VYTAPVRNLSLHGNTLLHRGKKASFLPQETLAKDRLSLV
jgi:hypothetical protein